MKNVIALVTATLAASPVFADISVRFIESAPKDRFVFVNGGCPLSQVAVEIDLTGSNGSLIFDVTAAGAGVEVFQPVEVQSDAVTLIPATDGDQKLLFRIDNFAAGAQVVISADLDDVLINGALGQIRVADDELSGTAVRMTIDGQTVAAAFDSGTDTAVLPHACTS